MWSDLREGDSFLYVFNWEFHFLFNVSRPRVRISRPMGEKTKMNTTPKIILVLIHPRISEKRIHSLYGTFNESGCPIAREKNTAAMIQGQ